MVYKISYTNVGYFSISIYNTYAVLLHISPDIIYYNIYVNSIIFY